MAQRPTTDDPVALFQNALRGAAGGHTSSWTCPLCNMSFQQGVKLWMHAKEAHQDSTDIMGSRDNAEAKQQFLKKAQHQATSNKAGRDPSPKAVSTRDSTKANIGDNIRHRDQDRPSSAPGNQSSGSKLEHAEYTTPERKRLTQPQELLIPMNIPQKRPVGGDFGPPESAKETNSIGSMAARGRHTQTSSGGFFIGTETGLSRQQTAQDPEFIRVTTGPKKPLWDSEADPLSGRTHWRNRDQSHTKTGHRRQTQTARDQQHSRPDLDQDISKMQYHDYSFNENTTQPVNLEGDQNPPSGQSPHVEGPSGEDFEVEPEMLLQPETRPISHEQLVVEVKGIYAGLVMVEAKCIDIDERQSAAAQEKDLLKRTHLKNDQWQSLIALHKQLLHEHHDFFLASQHPSASPALSRLAAKYSMPARMWRHGIHAFLEVLRHRLPESLEHMLAFIYIAYSMMALLYETVSTFEDTWIECLGDLGRYRMAIEDDEPKDREVWSNVARFWYNKAADKSPTVGRLYHHLAILARPYTLEQLSLYARSLTCVTPFESARGSIMTLFNPVLQGRDNLHRRASSLEILFIRAHAILFTSQILSASDRFNMTVDELEKDGLFDKYITKAGARFRELGAFAAISNIAALFEYGTPKQGNSKPMVRLAYEKAQIVKERASNPESGAFIQPRDPFASGEDIKLDSDTTLPQENEVSTVFISQPSRLASITLGLSLNRTTDKNVYPLVHVYLVFIWSLIIVQEAWRCFEKDVAWGIIERDIPWLAICFFLNALAGELHSMTSKIFAREFPHSGDEKGDKEKARPLPEDFVLRGQMYSQWYFPSTWFTNTMVDDDERTLELPSMVQPRMERILWLGHRIASVNRWIRFDVNTNSFVTTDYVANKLNNQAEAEPESADFDTIMIDASNTDETPRTPGMALSDSHHGTIENTPRTLSLVPSEIPNDSLASARTSTPMEFQATNLPQPTTPNTIELERNIEDTPMADISPGKGISATAIKTGKDPPEYFKSSPAEWVQDSTLKPHEFEYVSDPQKLKDIAVFEDREGYRDV